ncbi:MAG: DUF2491 family protein [Methylococcaceae bacterium]
MFGRKTPPKKKQIKLELNSDISINLIDVAHIDLHPSFVRPEGLFFIQALGTVEDAGGARDIFNVYAENNDNHYLIEIEAIENDIKQAALYQNVLTLTPSEEEWKDILKEMASTEMGLDDIHYSRALGGSAKTIDLCKINEHIKTTEDSFDCDNQVMLFERKIQPFEFTERLKVTAELIDSREQAAVSFYIGFNVHPSTITILGN